MVCRALCTAVLLVTFLLCGADAWALSRELRFDQLHHRIWSTRDGAPSEIEVMAQTPDGFLWLGTANGLFRFDGVRFERYAAESERGLPSESISALYVTPDGALWIGCRYKGVARLDPDGSVTTYEARHGFAARPQVRSFALDREQRLWAVSREGVYSLEQGRWQSHGEDWGLSAGTYYVLYVDHAGNLWAASQSGLHRLAPGARRFEQVQVPTSVNGQFGMAADGAVLYSGGPGGARITGNSATRLLPGISTVIGSNLLLDRDGVTWLGTDTMLRRLSPTAAPEALADTPAHALLEDREGNIWAGGDGLLHQFRHNDVVPMLEAIGAIAPATHGDIWLAAFNAGLFRISGRDGSAQQIPMPEKQPTYLYRDAKGVLWIGGRSRPQLWRLDDDSGSKITPIDTPATMPDSFVSSVAADAGGALWLNLARSTPSLYRRTGSGWVVQEGEQGLPTAGLRRLLADPQGRVWFGYEDGQVAVLDQGHVRLYGVAHGLDVGQILTLYWYRSQLLVAGGSGMSVLSGGRFHMLAGLVNGRLHGVTGIVESDDGDLWLNGSDGITRITPDEVQRAAADSRYRMQMRRFDLQDGLTGRAVQYAPLPAATRADDGRLWFTTTTSLFRVDPRKLQHNDVPPPVKIERIKVDDRHTYASIQHLRLPIGTDRMQIDYTAASLTIPERVRFRYRLSGVDQAWQEAGTRRQAYYSNLSPGDYRFQVIAANNDGVWNQQGASLDFRIQPAYYQTRTFAVACIAAGLMLLWLLYLLRLRQLAARLRLQLGERYAERERIARELHDTLLQSVQGLIWRLDQLGRRLPPEEPVREDLREALDDAEDALAEGRDRVTALRENQANQNLYEQLALIAERLRGQYPAAIELRTEGSPHRLQAYAREEIARIASEALANALKHAQASRITVDIVYEAKNFELLIRDDGAGITPDILRAGGKPGHWGLQGMRERAQKIHAQLDIRCPGTGTDVQLRVPARRAYECLGKRHWLRRFR